MTHLLEYPKCLIFDSVNHKLSVSSPPTPPSLSRRTKQTYCLHLNPPLLYNRSSPADQIRQSHYTTPTPTPPPSSPSSIPPGPPIYTPTPATAEIRLQPAGPPVRFVGIPGIIVVDVRVLHAVLRAVSCVSSHSKRRVPHRQAIATQSLYTFILTFTNKKSPGCNSEWESEWIHGGLWESMLREMFDCLSTHKVPPP
ncbi:hypothetical protein BU16DRAFT_525959 [Lophium mytilinum]|uniref:Uncharacterized protein n=1 Tax=Lophium mytilinum TaxID=390894 RepID=A0A6A6QXN9_9PEZI|nr:hypothetical protein BU16DRAFT_525959 [Lophium mytilinum]